MSSNNLMPTQSEINALREENNTLKQRIAELEQKQYRIYLETLHDTLLNFVQQADLRELLRLILQQAAQVIQADAGFINVLLPDSPDQMRTMAGFGFFEMNVNLHHGRDAGLAGVVWQTGEPLVVYNYDQNAYRLPSVPAGTVAGGIIYPLVYKENVVGVMLLAYQDPERRFSEQAIEVIESFAQIATIAVKNAILSEDLRHNETLVEQIADTMQDILSVYDLKNYRTLYVNQAINTTLGYPKSAIIGQSGYNLLDIVHPEDAPLFLEMVAHLENGRAQRASVEYRLRDVSGHWRWFHARHQILNYEQGHPSQMLGILHDITERKDTQRTLAETEHRFKLLVEMLPLFVFIYQDGRITYLNPTAYEFCGYSVAELRERGSFVSLLHPDSASGVTAILQGFDEGRSADGHIETSLISKSGEVLWIDIYATEIQLDGKRALLCSGLDATQRRNAEEQRMALALEKERVQLLAEFVRDASHDFRTPLATINTSLYLLQRLHEKSQQEDHFRIIKQQVDLLDNLVEALLTMTKLDSGVAMRILPIDFKRLIGELHHDILSQKGRRDLQIELTLEESVSTILCDRVWFYKALQELLSNALTYARTTVHLSVKRTDDHLRIDVEDDGFGIPPSELPRIFERFYRGEISRAIGGLGVGLSIARKVIEAHGGTLSVVSQLGEFTRFTIRLDVPPVQIQPKSEEVHYLT